MYKIYGIKNCDSVKKAISWFKERDLPFSFFDYRVEGIEKEKIAAWLDQAGMEKIINKKSSSWRNLDAAEQKKIKTKSSAIKLLHAQPLIIKRPVIVKQNKVLTVGFDDVEFREKFKNK